MEFAMIRKTAGTAKSETISLTLTKSAAIRSAIVSSHGVRSEILISPDYCVPFLYIYG